MEAILESKEVVTNTMSMEERAHKLVPLKTAVEDLLCELRIDPTCLRIMAAGYSPDYSGVPIPPIEEGDPPNIEHGEKWVNPHPKVQLSKIVAGKLLHTLDL